MTEERQMTINKQQFKVKQHDNSHFLTARSNWEGKALKATATMVESSFTYFEYKWSYFTSNSAEGLVKEPLRMRNKSGVESVRL